MPEPRPVSPTVLQRVENLENKVAALGTLVNELSVLVKQVADEVTQLNANTRDIVGGGNGNGGVALQGDEEGDLLQ